MSRKRERAWYRREVERDLAVGLGPWRRRRLHEHLRSDGVTRAYHDRMVGAFRVLADREDGLSPVELEQVGAWLDAEWEDFGETTTAARTPPWGVATGGVLALAAAVLLVLLIRGGGLSPGEDDYLAARGGGDADLALEVLCGPPMRPAAEGCRLGEVMGFGYRVRGAAGDRRSLVLFGLDSDDGRVLYYAPTPVDPDLVSTRPVGWMAAGFTVDLGVNHRAGPVRVYGLLRDAPVSVADVDRMADALRALGNANFTEVPWHERVEACAPDQRCASATLTFDLEND